MLLSGGLLYGHAVAGKEYGLLVLMPGVWSDKSAFCFGFDGHAWCLCAVKRIGMARTSHDFCSDIEPQPLQERKVCGCEKLWNDGDNKRSKWTHSYLSGWTMEEPSRIEELKSDVLCSKTSRERELVKSSGVCVCVCVLRQRRRSP